jgi:hypothetical protein
VLCHVFKQVAYGVAVVSGYSFYRFRIPFFSTRSLVIIVISSSESRFRYMGVRMVSVKIYRSESICRVGGLRGPCFIMSFFFFLR